MTVAPIAPVQGVTGTGYVARARDRRRHRRLRLCRQSLTGAVDNLQQLQSHVEPAGRLRPSPATWTTSTTPRSPPPAPR